MTTPFLRLIYIFFILVNLKSIRGDEIYKQDFKEDVKSGIINSVSVSDSAAKPNIIIFLVDDMGWADTELNGSTFYESPNQIKLANEGMFFSQAYAQPLCSPSRAALLTGKYPGARLRMHVAVTGNSVPEPSLPVSSNSNEKMLWPTSRDHLPLNELTIAEKLRDNGYRTIHIGKWHLGGENYYPDKQGFDEIIGTGGAGTRSYFSPYNFPNLSDGPEGEYLCERFTEEACRMLKKYKDEPFFLYLAHVNVHSPYQAKRDLIDYYKSKSNMNNNQRHPKMGAMLHSVDESLGQIMDALDSLGLSENTLLLFISDNGGINWENDKDSDYADVPITSNYPLKGGKATYYEGGVRVPMIIKWPGKINPKSISDTPVHLIDIYPTILDILQIDPDPEQILDGISILPLLSGKEEILNRPLFCHFPRKSIVGEGNSPGGSFVRLGDFKLLRIYGEGKNRTDEFKLFNIKDDIGESRNIADENFEKAEELKELLDNWLIETGALIPKINPTYKNITE